MKRCDRIGNYDCMMQLYHGLGMCETKVNEPIIMKYCLTGTYEVFYNLNMLGRVCKNMVYLSDLMSEHKVACSVGRGWCLSKLLCVDNSALLSHTSINNSTY